MPATASYAPVLEAIRGLTWPARRRTRTAIPGAHVAVAQRAASELVDFRPYRQGDDPGNIDWKLVGRTDRVYVRLSPERALLPTVVVVDASASMAFPAATQAKWVLARQAALALAAIARADGDPAGLLLVGQTGTAWVAPRTRRSVLEEMIRVLDTAPAGSQALTPAVAPVLRRCARLALVTDFLGDAEELLALARRFVAAGGEVHAVHVVDAVELDPGTATLLCADPEQPDLRRPFSASTRTLYLRRFGAWRESIARAWRGAGARYAQVVPGAEPFRHMARRITASLGPGERR